MSSEGAAEVLNEALDGGKLALESSGAVDPIGAVRGLDVKGIVVNETAVFEDNGVAVDVAVGIVKAQVFETRLVSTDASVATPAAMLTATVPAEEPFSTSKV